MIECDLNCNDHFERIPNHDVTVFSGVMEYINDLPSVVNKLSTKTNNIVCSYAVKTDLATLDKRTKNGWVNHYTKIELLKLFDNNNFNCIHMSTWNTQLILQFEKNK